MVGGGVCGLGLGTYIMLGWKQEGGLFVVSVDVCVCSIEEDTQQQ